MSEKEQTPPEPVETPADTQVDGPLSGPLSPKGHWTLKKTVVMVGMMGAGKTAVGRGLAARLKVPFLDSDHEIEVAADRTIPEIFARDGEPFFRQKERQVIARLLEEERGVLSTGGGAFLAEENRNTISQQGVSVWLKADLDVLWNRVKHRDTRPLLRTADPYATLSSIYNDRVPFYAEADLAVVSDGQASIDEMVDRVIDALKARPDVLEWT
ncbi:shikimate kinase [Phaeobacter sp.]|uniref:shikimate kinase n=1 Tax=Phaeobacter sp. TaxID=1902409 RepID=UPI0025EDF01E|nr:shikimate kinase [Phaeobacter sp.]